MTNRNHKDRLFVRIFSDLEHKDWIISLVNALSGTHYTEDELIEVNTIEEILYIKMKNDVSYLIDHQLFLIEHQSSFNPNMPLRGLIYFGQLYDSYIQQHNLNVYSTRRIKLPRPHFFVMYNGTRDVPDVLQLRLSDSFDNDGTDTPDDIGFEWTATMYNINAGHNEDLLSDCLPLSQYSQFVAMIHENRRTGLPLDAALEQAVDYAINLNFLDGLFLKLKGDIMSILFKEYTDEEANALFYHDGHDVGYDEGFDAGRLEGYSVGAAAGAAEQRAKDTAELAAQAAKLAQYEKLYGKIEL